MTRSASARRSDALHLQNVCSVETAWVTGRPPRSALPLSSLVQQSSPPRPTYGLHFSNTTPTAWEKGIGGPMEMGRVAQGFRNLLQPPARSASFQKKIYFRVETSPTKFGLMTIEFQPLIVSNARRIPGPASSPHLPRGGLLNYKWLRSASVPCCVHTKRKLPCTTCVDRRSCSWAD